MSHASVYPPIENAQQLKATQAEREDFVRALVHYIKGMESTQEIDLSTFYISHRPNSLFDEIYGPAKELLESTTLSPDFIASHEAWSASGMLPPLRVDIEGNLYAGSQGGWHNLMEDIKYFSELQQTLSMIGEIALHAGGYIYFAHDISVEQWLRFNQLTVPTTVAEAGNLIDFLSLDLPAGPPIGNCWQAVSGHENSPFVLSKTERGEVARLTLQAFSRPQQMLEELARPVIGNRTSDEVQAGADYLLDQILETSTAIEWAKEYLNVTGWYGAHEDQETPKEHLQSLLVAAIILAIDPLADITGTEVAGYELYQPSNVDRSPETVREDLDRHLVGLGRDSGVATPLATFILLAGIAPEFLVRGLPTSIRLGTPAWVALTQAVALAEAYDPGSSRLMSYAELLKFSALEPVTPELELLHNASTIKPVINWATMNKVISPDAHGQYDKPSLIVAIDAYQQHINRFDQVIHSLTTPLPSRRNIALAQLQKAYPNCRFLETVSLTKTGRGFNPGRGSRLKMSVVDLHMSDDLVTLDWNNTNDIYPELPDIEHLTPASELYEVAFDAYHQNLEAGILTNIKLALSQLPALDRTALQMGEISVYTVRKSVARPYTTPVSSIGLIGAGIQPTHYKETQQDKDAATCRYAVIITASYQGEVDCYELFTLRGECRKNNALGRLIVSSGKINSPARVDFTGNFTEPTPAVSPFQMPIDFLAYSQGFEPREGISSSAVIEKLGMIAAPLSGAPSIGSHYQSFLNEQLEKLALFIVQHRPFASYEELKRNGEGRTALELERDKAEKIETFIIDLVVPFKKCIEDLSSDSSTTRAEGAVGCILDGLAVVGSIIGLSAKLTSAASKATSFASRSAQLGKLTSRLAVSLLNPLDGAPDLLFSGAHLIKKGALQFSKHSLAAIEAATFQVRRLTGSAQTYDLLKAANRTDILQGSWKKLGDTGEPAHLLIVEKRGDWYALNVKTGSPWGAPLRNLKLTDFIPVRGWHRLLPKNYSRAIIKNALPVARNKVSNAIEVLASRLHDTDRKFVYRTFFGDDSSAIAERYLDDLLLIKDDLDAIKTTNFTIEASTQKSVIGGLYPGKYRSWQAASKADAPLEEFIVFYADHLNDFYRSVKYDNSAIADVLIHEMSHGGPDTLDFFYAQKSQKHALKSGEVDVAELLNLAKGRTHIDLSSKLAGADAPILLDPPAFIPSELFHTAPALLNADSQSMVTSLLSQLKTNAPAFYDNLSALRRALKNAGSGRVIDPVRINLGKSSQLLS